MNYSKKADTFNSISVRNLKENIAITDIDSLFKVINSDIIQGIFPDIENKL